MKWTECNEWNWLEWNKTNEMDGEEAETEFRHVAKDAFPVVVVVRLKGNEMKWMKWNEMKWNEMKWMKWNEMKQILGLWSGWDFNML